MSIDSPGHDPDELWHGDAPYPWKNLLQTREDVAKLRERVGEARSALKRAHRALCDDDQNYMDRYILSSFNYTHASRDDAETALLKIKHDIESIRMQEDKYDQLEDQLLEEEWFLRQTEKRYYEYSIPNSSVQYDYLRPLWTGDLVRDRSEVLNNEHELVLSRAGTERDLCAPTATDTVSKICRRGRGQRKNRTYWNWRRDASDLDLYERDILIGARNGNLTIPAIARLDSSSDILFRISEEYLKQQGRVQEIDTDLTDEERRNMEDNPHISGIVRNLPFRIRGTSRTFFHDFIVTRTLNDVADIVIGWQFMWEEFKLLFKDVRGNLAGSVRGAASTFSEKISSLSSKLRRLAADFLPSDTPSPPPPPYSLFSVFERDFL